MIKASNQTVLIPQAFMQDLRAEAIDAQERIVSQAMCIDTGPIGNQVLGVFTAAPSRVTKELYLDWYTRMIYEQSILAWNDLIPWLRASSKRMRAAKDELFEQCANTGVTVRFTNEPQYRLVHFFPFVGRNHIKGTNIDNRVFYIGGRNFDDASRADFMVKFVGPIAKALSRVFDAIHREPPTIDTVLSLTPDHKLYIDAGTGKSLILETAVTLIEQALHTIRLTAALPPDGPIAYALSRAARRGVSVEVTIGSPTEAKGIVFKILCWFNRIWYPLTRSGVQIHTLSKLGMHAKLLIVDGGTADQKAYFGSHNLSYAGVRARTQEWGIVTTDDDLIGNLNTFYSEME